MDLKIMTSQTFSKISALSFEAACEAVRDEAFELILGLGYA